MASVSGRKSAKRVQTCDAELIAKAQALRKNKAAFRPLDELLYRDDVSLGALEVKGDEAATAALCAQRLCSTQAIQFSRRLQAAANDPTGRAK